MYMNDYSELLTNTNYKDVAKIIEDIGTYKTKEAISTLIELLEKTEDNSLRNKIALVLSDLKEQTAVEVIIRVIQNPKTEGNRGTLLYALTELDYSNYLDFIFTLLIEGSYEVKREAFFLIEKSLEEKNENIDTIKNQIPLLVEKIRELQDETEFYLSAINLFSK